MIKYFLASWKISYILAWLDTIINIMGTNRSLKFQWKFQKSLPYHLNYDKWKIHLDHQSAQDALLLVSWSNFHEIFTNWQFISRNNTEVQRWSGSNYHVDIYFVIIVLNKSEKPVERNSKPNPMRNGENFRFVRSRLIYVRIIWFLVTT